MKCRVIDANNQLVKQGGRMFVDRMFNENSSIEIFCIQCGSRKMLDKKSTNKFVRWLIKKEDFLEHNYLV
jgi:hypothetical protein